MNRPVAQREGISINQLVSSALAEKMSALLTEEYLEARARPYGAPWLQPGGASSRAKAQDLHMSVRSVLDRAVLAAMAVLAVAIALQLLPLPAALFAVLCAIAIHRAPVRHRTEQRGGR